MLGVAAAVRAKRAALRVEIGEAAHSGRTTVLLVEGVLAEVVHGASRCRSRVSRACPGLAHAIGFLAGWAHPAMVDISAALAGARGLVQGPSVRTLTLAGALRLSPGKVEQVKVSFPGPDISPRGLFDTEVVVNRFAHSLHNRRVHSKSFEQSVQSHESHVDDRVCRTNVS